MFPTATYITRRQKLKSEVKNGILLFPGNGESSMNYKDNWYPFRQDSSFLYYTGVNNIPNIYFLIDIENDKEILFGDDPTPEEMVWTGAVTPLSILAEKSGIAEVKSMKELPAYIKQQQQKGNPIHFLPPYRSETTNELSNLLNIPVGVIEKNKSDAFIKAVVKQRVIKTSEEIKELNKAVNITAAMHTHAIKNTRPGKTEKEIAGELQAIAIGGGGNISFPIILTKNGQYLHNHATQAVIEEGDIVLCDCGAETAMNYAGDMTRTFPAGKRFSSLQKDVYNIVLNAHNSAIAALKPGILFRDIHLLACTKLTEGLKAMGLMKGDVQEAVAVGAHTLFFQCGLGHMMGMDVHDMENLGESYVGYTDDLKKSTAFGLKSLRLGKALEAGNVLTVEPGIYFNPFLIDSWKTQKKYTDFVNYDEVEKFKDFGGIRVEEDLLITASGSELLGEPLVKTPEDIEELKNV
ncbi:aminopeptidase P family protein [Galbibacter sp. EGI 63066]|uniref:aminopeptidase P family protein n=1 Tax=Galbibacter sp. EGI 63066 TaxID=2993559 RepID=UPI002249993D|nr:aminopeptidase P family protein [Galbibacter sp. EGI 63066]MCX2678635.1 aminopeptidase P family protein [Galbibacter sp. EGI 63066]